MKKYLTLTLILVVTFFCFYPCLDAGFVTWDDGRYVLNNPKIRSIDFDNIVTIFKEFNPGYSYVPLTTFSFAVEYHFFKLDPFYYHLNNLLLHLLVVALVFFFALQCNLSLVAAGIAAFIFGIHPIHVESVAWVSERKDVLYSLFYMLALIQYVRYCKYNKISGYWWSLFFGCFSVFSKSMAVSLPLILLLCDWYFKRKWSFKILLEKVPYFIYIIPMSYISYLYMQPFYDKNPWQTQFFQEVMNWVWCFTFYLKKFIFPYVLIIVYPFPKNVSFFNPQYLMSFWGMYFIIWSLVKFKKARFYIFSFMFYFLSIFFLLQHKNVDTRLVNDRFMYLPSLGFCLLIGDLFFKFLNKKSLKKSVRLGFIAIILAVTVLLCFKTFQQTKIWRDDLSLWKHNIAHHPYHMFYVNRGLLYQKQGKLNLAVSDYENALKNNPNNPAANNNLGNIYKGRGDYEAAFKYFSRAIESDPEFKYAYQNRARLYYQQGQYDLALQDVLTLQEMGANDQARFILELKRNLD